MRVAIGASIVSEFKFFLRSLCDNLNLYVPPMSILLQRSRYFNMS